MTRRTSLFPSTSVDALGFGLLYNLAFLRQHSLIGSRAFLQAVSRRRRLPNWSLTDTTRLYPLSSAASGSSKPVRIVEF